MLAINWVQISFSAAHAAYHDEFESSLHGHRYMVRAYLEAKYDPILPPKLDELRTAMKALRYELHGTTIDHMLPGVSTTPAGIAAWMLERLPQCSAVRVSADDDSATMVSRRN